MAGLENEAIVFADRVLQEDLLGQIRTANILVGNTTTRSVGTALRITAKSEPKRFFELVLRWWEANRKSGALVTLRTSRGLTVELRESTLPEVRKMIEHS